MSPLILKFTKEMFIYMSILCAKTKLPLPLSSCTPPRGSLCTRRCTPHTLGIPGLDNFSYLTKCLILIYMKIIQCWSIITTWCDWPLKLNSNGSPPLKLALWPSSNESSLLLCVNSSVFCFFFKGEMQIDTDDSSTRAFSAQILSNGFVSTTRLVSFVMITDRVTGW